MRLRFFTQKIFLILALFGGLFQVAHAGIADNAIKTWNTPAPEGVYGYTDSITYQGTVQIPAGWIGRVRVCKDIGGSSCRTAYTGAQSYDNTTQGTTTETFSVDTGVWASGSHTARIAFDGAMACRLTCGDTDYACQLANNSDGDPTNDWCPQSTENQVIDQQYPVRNITIGPPPLPSLAITPDTVHFWNHPVGSSVVTETVTITNVGAVGTIAAGSASQVTGAGKFACQSGCSYSLSPGDSHTMTISFTPPGTIADWTGSFNLTCTGCMLPTQTLSVDGSTIAAGSSAEITLEYPTISFGTVNLGSTGETFVHITNTGGSPMSGTVDITDPQVSCDGSCAFSLDAGEDTWRRFFYTPTIAAPLSGVTATFRATSGGASTVTLPVEGEGNASPILGVWSYDTGDNVYDGAEIQINRINQGDTGIVELDVYNRGAGVLEASLAGLPSGVFTCISGCGPTYPSLLSYTQTGYYETLRFQVSLPDASEQVLYLTFRDTTPGGSGDTIQLTVRVTPNTEPVPQMVGNYPCTLNFGNVLAGDNTLPLPDPDTNDGFGQQEECGIRNIGVGSLKVTVPNFSLNGTGRYDCVAGAGLSCGTFYLAAGEEAQFKYRFTALAADPEPYMHDWNPIGYVPAFEGFPGNDSIHIHASPMSIGLTVAPESDPAYDFGLTNINVTSPYKSYLLSLDRIGGVDNTVYFSSLPGSITWMMGSTTHFRCTTRCSGTLLSSGSTSRSPRIVFSPGTDTGVIAENMTIPYTFGGWTNAPAPTPISLDLLGEGNDQPVLELSGDIIPPVVDFGSVNVGTPKTSTLTLANIGVGDLTGSFAAFAAPFTCIDASCAGFTISEGSSKDFTLRFTPPSNIAYEEMIDLTTTGGNRTLTLRGVGKYEPELTLSTNFINFDTLTDPSSQTSVGDVRTTMMRITNTGAGTMSVTAHLTLPTSNFLFPAQSFSLNAGSSTDVDVQFSPVRDTIPLSGQITFDATDGGTWSDHKTLDLTGTGAFASLTDFRGPLPNFGPVVFGKDKTLVLTLRNAGVRPLGQGEFQFPVDSPFVCIASQTGMSSTTGNCLYDIGPNGEQSLTVKFTPKGLGAVSVDMSFSSLPEYSIEFTGTGVPPRFNYKEQ